MPPEGFQLAVVRRDDRGVPIPVDGVTIDVEGGRVLTAQGPHTAKPPLKTVRISVAPGARRVRVRATVEELRAEQTFAVGPPAARVELSLQGEPPIKGRSTHADIDIRLLREDGTPDPDSPPPVLQTNVGALSPPVEIAPGHFRTRYELPQTRYPEVAVIVAFAPWPHPHSIHGAVGSLLVPLATSIDLPGRSERNARTSIEIAGRTFGPVEAGPDGRFLIPVVVPPGHRYGKGTAIDRAGNRKVRRVDLMLPPTDQLACVMNPRRLPADGVSRARVVCATTDPYGRPQKSARVDLDVAAGRRSERRTLGEGLYEWIYTAPAALTDAPIRLTATSRDGRHVSKDLLDVTLLQGPAESVRIAAAAPMVHYGGALTLTATVRDGLDRPRGGATLMPAAPFGSFSEPEETAPGIWRLLWTPPGDGDASRARIAVRAFGPPGNEPARLTTWTEGGEVKAGVLDLVGWPVPDQVLKVGDREVRTGPDGSASLGVLAPGTYDIQHAQWPGISVRLHVLAGGLIFPEGDRPVTPPASIDVALAPPIPVNVRIQVEGRRVTYWAEDLTGRILTRDLALSVTGAEAGARSVAKGRTSFTLQGHGPAQVSVSDLETGVTAVAEVPP